MTTINGQTPPGEQREHARRSFLQSVTIHVGDRASKGMIQNISPGGVYIEAGQSFSVGRRITISYLMAGNTSEIEIQGEVVRADENGFGMAYT